MHAWGRGPWGMALGAARGKSRRAARTCLQQAGSALRYMCWERRGIVVAGAVEGEAGLRDWEE